MSTLRPEALPQDAADELERIHASSGDRDAAGELAETRVVRWRDLDDRTPETTFDAWNDLIEYVDWLVIRYRLPTSQIPHCWYRHGNLVEELSALNTAWKAAFDDSDSGYGPIGWHERLESFLTRLPRLYSNGCMTQHNPWPGRAADPLEEEARRDDIAAWSIETHGENS